MEPTKHMPCTFAYGSGDSTRCYSGSDHEPAMTPRMASKSGTIVQGSPLVGSFCGFFFLGIPCKLSERTITGRGWDVFSPHLLLVRAPGCNIYSMAFL